MLRIKPKELKALMLGIVDKTDASEALSPSSCIKVTQDEKRLEVGCYTPSKGYHVRYISNNDDSTGGDGSEFLLDSDELIAKVNRLISSQTITFVEDSGILTLNSNYKIVNNKPKRSAVVSVRQYGGASSDFPDLHNVFDEEPELLCSVRAADFKKWLILGSFGEFSDKSAGLALGRTLVVTVKDDSLMGLTNSRAAYVAYMQISLKADVSTEANFALEGTQLDKLESLLDPKDLGDDSAQTIEIYSIKDEETGFDWVVFKGKRGFSIIRAEEPNSRYEMNKILFSREQRVTDYAERGFSINEFSDSIIAMKPSSADDKQLLLTEEDGGIKCSQANAISSKNWAATNLDVQYSKGDWNPIIVNAPALLSINKSILSHMKASGYDSNVVFVDLRFIQKKQSKTWLFYLRPLSESDSSHIRLESCMVSRDALEKEALMEIDTDE